MELQDPAPHHDGNPDRGELTHERIEPFAARFSCDRQAAALAAHLVLLLEEPDPPIRRSKIRALSGRTTRT